MSPDSDYPEREDISQLAAEDYNMLVHPPPQALAPPSGRFPPTAREVLVSQARYNMLLSGLGVSGGLAWMRARLRKARVAHDALGTGGPGGGDGAPAMAEKVPWADEVDWDDEDVLEYSEQDQLDQDRVEEESTDDAGGDPDQNSSGFAREAVQHTRGGLTQWQGHRKIQRQGQGQGRAWKQEAEGEEEEGEEDELHSNPSLSSAEARISQQSNGHTLHARRTRQTRHTQDTQRGARDRRVFPSHSQSQPSGDEIRSSSLTEPAQMNDAHSTLRQTTTRSMPGRPRLTRSPLRSHTRAGDTVQPDEGGPQAPSQHKRRQAAAFGAGHDQPVPSTAKRLRRASHRKARY